MNRAAALAAQGDFQSAQALLSPILTDPKVKEVLETREDSHG